MTINLWLDDIRPIPVGPKFKDCWILARSVNEAKENIREFQKLESSFDDFEGHDSLTLVIHLDHDLGDFAKDGGDAIRLLDWIEAEEIDTTNFVFKIHTANPVGRENMLRVIRKNGWREGF